MFDCLSVVNEDLSADPDPDAPEDVVALILTRYYIYSGNTLFITGVKVHSGSGALKPLYSC